MFLRRNGSFQDHQKVMTLIVITFLIPMIIFLQFIQIWRRCFKILIFYLILFFQPVQKGVEIAQTEYSQHSSILAN